MYSRSFMKVQQLAAVMGGMTKSIFNLFAVYAMFQAINSRDDVLQKEFYRVKVVANPNFSNVQLQEDPTKVNTVIGVKRESSNLEKCSLWLYLMRSCCKNAEELSKERVIEQMRSYMHVKMDVMYLFKQFEEFSRMKEMVLTEEQIELLEGNKTEVEVSS